MEGIETCTFISVWKNVLRVCDHSSWEFELQSFSYGLRISFIKLKWADTPNSYLSRTGVAVLFDANDYVKSSMLSPFNDAIVDSSCSFTVEMPTILFTPYVKLSVISTYYYRQSCSESKEFQDLWNIVGWFQPANVWILWTHYPMAFKTE